MIEPARMRAPAPIRASPETPGRPEGYPSRTPGSTMAPAPRCTSAAPGRSHFNGRSSRAHRRLDRHESPDDAEAEARLRERRPAARDRLDEFLALVLQRLAPPDLPAGDGARADEQPEFAVRNRDRLRGRDAALESPRALGLGQGRGPEAAA